MARDVFVVNWQVDTYEETAAEPSKPEGVGRI